MAIIEVKVPQLSESVSEATIGKWFKKAGDAVKVDEPLVELETDKVTVEVPAPSSGIMGEIFVAQGTTVAALARDGCLLASAVAGGSVAGDLARGGPTGGPGARRCWPRLGGGGGGGRAGPLPRSAVARAGAS